MHARLTMLAITLAIAGCYEPDLRPCRVTCASGNCPGAQACLEDGYCHAAGDTELCDLDAGPGVDATPDAGPDAMPPAEVTAISVGGDHACAISGGHLVIHGQIGDGTSAKHTPQSVIFP